MAKVGGQFRALLVADNPDTKVEEILTSVENDVEPLLASAAPFYDGSKELTFAEVRLPKFFP